MSIDEYAAQYLDLLVQSRKQIRESMIQKPVSGEEYVIEYLAKNPGPVYPSELSEKMQASTARIAAILRHLEGVSEIERGEDENDARKHPIVLSRAGHERAREIHDRRIKVISEIFKTIGEEETKEYIRITKHIIQICREMEVRCEESTDCEKGSA